MFTLRNINTHFNDEYLTNRISSRGDQAKYLANLVTIALIIVTIY